MWPSFVKRVADPHAHVAIEASAGVVRFREFSDSTRGIEFARGVRVRVTDRETVVEHAPPDAPAAQSESAVPTQSESAAADAVGGGLAFDPAIHYRLRVNAIASLTLRSGARACVRFGSVRFERHGDTTPFVLLCGHDSHLAIQGSSYHMYGAHVHVIAHNATVTPSSDEPSRALAEAYTEGPRDFAEGLLTHTIAVTATGNSIVRGLRAYFVNVTVDETALVRVRAAYACAISHQKAPDAAEHNSTASANARAAKLRKIAVEPATRGSELDRIVASLANVDPSAPQNAVEARATNAGAARPRVEVLNTNACRPFCKTCWCARAECAVLAC